MCIRDRRKSIVTTKGKGTQSVRRKTNKTTQTVTLNGDGILMASTNRKGTQTLTMKGKRTQAVTMKVEGTYTVTIIGKGTKAVTAKEK